MKSLDTIDILIVDDHTLVRDGIASLLDSQEDIKVVAQASTGEEALLRLEKGGIDVVLMDIHMPDMNGIEATREVTAKFPDVKVLALTMHKERGYITKMLQAGARGFILKEIDQEELSTAILSVARGDNYFSSKVSSIMMESYMSNSGSSGQQQSEVPPSELTRREEEVLRLIADELTNSEIAEKLFISIRTVDTHRRNLLQKLGVKNTAGLVKYAINHNLINT